MVHERLVDLDELVLRCRDEQAQRYIAEAVACYKVGAFRSCIVATWIAIVFDFLYKLRELDLTGDKNANGKLEEFEKIRRSGDVTGSLNFEKKILDVARDEFQLLTPLEYTDLSRLLEDRNRCAHPSMNSVEDSYQPTAELARYHMRNAITYLLERPPVQGKAAIDWLVNEINSVYFPTSPEMAAHSFASGPLGRPTDALVRNFLIVLIKTLHSGSLDESTKRRYHTAVNAVRQMHRTIAEQTFVDKLNDIVKTLSDELFGRAMQFVEQVPDTWQYLRGDVRTRMNIYVKNMPYGDIVPNLHTALRITELKSTACEKLKHISRSQLVELFKLDENGAFRNEFADEAVVRYEKAGSFHEANSIATEMLIPLAGCITPLQTERIVKTAAVNIEVRDSFELINVLCALRAQGQMSKSDVDALLRNHGLNDFLDKITKADAEEDDIEF
jgi:hypothetical protein